MEKETSEGQTNYCEACECKVQEGELGLKHTCGIKKIKLETLCRREWWRGFITAQDKYRIIRSKTDMKELKREYAKYIKSNPEVKKEINESKEY